MKNFKGIFREDDQTKLDNTKSQQLFREAETALRADDFAACMRLLRAANQACCNQKERVYLFGLLRSRPSEPLGIAGLADYSIVVKHNVANTYALLGYIEETVGTAIALCEVWFSMFQEAIEQERYELAREAFHRCLYSQGKQGDEKHFRIDRQFMLDRCGNIASRHAGDVKRAARILYLQVMLEKGM